MGWRVMEGGECALLRKPVTERREGFSGVMGRDAA